MYLPNNLSLLGALTPTAGIDLSLHTLLGLSWHILLPYTLLGAALMIYSQGRLARGERELRRQEKLESTNSL
jgi:hypothetical protein